GRRSPPTASRPSSAYSTGGKAMRWSRRKIGIPRGERLPARAGRPRRLLLEPRLLAGLQRAIARERVGDDGGDHGVLDDLVRVARGRRSWPSVQDLEERGRNQIRPQEQQPALLDEPGRHAEAVP